MIIDLQPYSLPLRVPLLTAHGAIEHREGVLVSLSDGTHTGWGEAAPMPGWSTHNLDSVSATLAAVVAQGVTDLDAVLDQLEPMPAARAALAGAMADLGAQQRGLPLARDLAAGAADRVPVNAVIAIVDPAAAAEAAHEATAAGITTLKVKVGGGPLEGDRARLSAIRNAVPADTEVRIDANGGWTPEQAGAALEALAEFAIAFCEEPTPGIEAIAALGMVSPIPVAVDESAQTVDDIAAALGTGAIDVVIVKPQAIGGPDLAVRALGLAAEVGATAIVTTMIDSAVGVALAAHVAATAGASLAHGLATSTLLAADVAEALPIVDGHVVLPDADGLGVTPT